MSTAIEEPKQKTGTQLDQLEQLKRFTKVVADTGDFDTIKEDDLRRSWRTRPILSR